MENVELTTDIDAMLADLDVALADLHSDAAPVDLLAEIENDLIETVEATSTLVAEMPEEITLEEADPVEAIHAVELDLDELAAELEGDKQWAETPKKVRKTAVTPKERKPAAKRIAEGAVLGMKPSEAIEKIFGTEAHQYMAWDKRDADLSQSELDAKIEARYEKVDGLNKKQRERIVNAMHWLSGHGQLRRFTRVGIDALIAAGGTMTFKEMRESFSAIGFSNGTASSASGNSIHTMLALEIATRDGATLHLNPESTILELYNGSK